MLTAFRWQCQCAPPGARYSPAHPHSGGMGWCPLCVQVNRLKLAAGSVGDTASARAKARHEALNPTAKRRWDVFQWSVGVEESVVSEGASVLQSEGAEQRWETRHCYPCKLPFLNPDFLEFSFHALICGLVGDHG